MSESTSDLAIAKTGSEEEVRCFGEGDASVTCYEARPDSLSPYRLIRSPIMTAFAPSLSPRNPDDQVHTNRQDIVFPARLVDPDVTSRCMKIGLWLNSALRASVHACSQTTFNN
ncbi:hypothetical protein ACRQ5Q_08680 [Bradyrhizobium sp. PMVTL-01]|uniref:hypothetical protein n=1 Tax=Bradyrhizobium sp. PMVTL-01 TaxID=3434999 RepID=UPI003F6FED9B